MQRLAHADVVQAQCSAAGQQQSRTTESVTRFVEETELLRRRNFARTRVVRSARDTLLVLGRGGGVLDHAHELESANDLGDVLLDQALRTCAKVAVQAATE